MEERIRADKAIFVKTGASLTFQDVMDEKQYEMWFENTRFLDLVRWSNAGKVDLNKIFNESGIHDLVPVVHDAFFEGEAAHRLYVEYTEVDDKPFENKHKYFPFPRDILTANPEMHNVLGWAE